MTRQTGAISLIVSEKVDYCIINEQIRIYL
jgi:hypothetical protein